MKFSDKLNACVHPLFVRYVLRAYRRKSERVEREHPELFRAVSPELVEKHKGLWGRLGLPCSDRWLRFHVNLTGIEDYRFCPEDLFFAHIERILVPSEMAGQGIEDKNSLDAFFGRGLFPETVIRYMRGCFFDADYHWLSEDAVNRVLRSDQGELVVKPCIASSGGVGIEAIRFENGCYLLGGLPLDAARIRQIGGISFAVQRRLISDTFSAQFNPSSANTCRMMTLRCPWDGEIVVLKTMMRIGVSEAIVDNMMKGGLCVNLDACGRFGRYGYDYNGARFESHPVSGIRFEGLKHPAYDQMVKVATQMAQRVPYFNLLSFDLLPDANGQVKIVEINATSQGITQLQYDHGGLFGEYSEAVVDWCVSHRELDTFKHFRTFY